MPNRIVKSVNFHEEREKVNPEFAIRQIELEMQGASNNHKKELERELKFYKQLKEKQQDLK